MPISKVKTTLKMTLKTEEKKTASVTVSKRVVAIDPKTAKPKPNIRELYIDQSELKRAKEAERLEANKKQEREKKALEKKTMSEPIKLKAKPKQLDIPPAPIVSKPTKVIYHISKLDKDSNQWKLFIQGSTSIIKVFDSHLEALEYAQDLCNKRRNGSYILLHGPDGKIRKH